ncbi:hypothetical protein ACLB1R_35795 [Escherichia coli]
MTNQVTGPLKRLILPTSLSNLIMLDNLKTLATAVALKATDNTPLAIIRTSVLRRQDGSIITGQLNGTLTVRKMPSSALRLPELRSSLVKLNRCHWILVMVKSARIPLLPL